jgi:probable F420-dependent oxidoreductase
MHVGTVVRLGPVGETFQPSGYTVIRDMARQMEAAGLDSIWVYDHLLYRWPNRPTTDGVWECWTMLAALAEATERVQLGPLVTCTQFRNPALLAKMAASVDEISGGRLTLGLGAGWHQPEFDAFGYPFDHRVGRFEEAVRIIRPLLRDGRVDFHGAYASAAECEMIPRGPRGETGGPPLMLAGARPRMLRLAVEFADSWNTAWHAAPESVAPRLELIREACRAAGRDPATLPVSACVNVVYPDLGKVTVAQALSGSPDEIAQALHGYAQLGIAHVMVEVAPYAPEAINRFAEAVSIFRTL